MKTSMNNLLWISGMTISVTAAILITNATIFSNAYGCTNSTSTNHTNSSSIVNVNSSVSVKPGALISQSRISTVASTVNGAQPNLGLYGPHPNYHISAGTFTVGPCKSAK